MYSTTWSKGLYPWETSMVTNPLVNTSPITPHLGKWKCCYRLLAVTTLQRDEVSDLFSRINFEE